MVMMKKQAAKFIAPVLCLILAISFFPAAQAKASGSKITSESIQEKEKQINQAKNDIKGLKNGLSDVQKIKKELEKEKSDLKKYVAALDQKLAQLEQSIIDLKRQIVDKEAKIADTTEELNQAETVKQNQYDYIVASIRYFYEMGTQASLWEILFSSESFGDFLNRMDYMNRVYAYDQQVWEEYQLNCEYIELCREQLEVERELLDEQKQNVEQEQANVEELVEEKKRQITNYETDIANKEKAIQEYEQEIKDQNAIIAELEKLIEEEREQLRLKYDGGMFKFPLASYTRISDEYGWRIHPTLGVRQFHNGVDLASPKGTAIYAAYDGEVVAATYNATMGNYVMINHGDGLYTIYMHASALYVKAGDTVKRGDTIAAVGSTGRSTGNHLHFGVRKNGEYVSPWDYLSK